MKLERTLTELETLVEYGCGYLLNRNIKNVHPLDILPNMNQSDILVYTIDNFSYDEILDEMNESDFGDIDRWIRCNRNVGQIGFDDDDIQTYVADNYFDEFLADVSLDDFMDSKCMTTQDALDELGDDEIEDYVHSRVDDLSLDEFLSMKGMDDEDILDNIDGKTLFEYVTSNYTLAYWAAWKDEFVNG